MKPIDAARLAFKQPVVIDREINQYISKIQPMICTDKEYTDKLHEKEMIDKNQVHPDYTLPMLTRPPIRQQSARDRNPQSCSCCREQFGWTRGKTFCSFCGLYCCSECQTKQRFLPTMRNFQEPLEICMNCELILIEFMDLNRFESKVKKVKTAFTRLADEQGKLETLIQFEKQKSISKNADLNEVISKGMEIEKQKKRNAEVDRDITELKQKIQKAKVVNTTLMGEYNSKHAALGRRASIIALPQLGIDQDEQLQPPRPQQSQASQQLYINQSIVNSILQRSISVNKIPQQQPQYKHRCQCTLI